MAGGAKLVGNHALVAKTMLKKVTGILDDLGVEYILNFGTLLGVVRENSLLPWDSDLDISICEKDISSLQGINRLIRKAGFRSRIRYYKKDVGPYKKGDVRVIKVQTRKFHFMKGINLLDIFVVRTIDGECTYSVMQDKSFMLKSFPCKYQEETTKLEFDGKLYTVPEKYTDYLEYVYGDWKTPVKEWDYFAGDNCSKELIK